MGRPKLIHAEGAGFTHQLNVKVPPAWVVNLKRLAKLNNRSMASEHRAILENVLGPNSRRLAALRDTKHAK